MHRIKLPTADLVRFSRVKGKSYFDGTSCIFVVDMREKGVRATWNVHTCFGKKWRPVKILL